MPEQPQPPFPIPPGSKYFRPAYPGGPMAFVVGYSCFIISEIGPNEREAAAAVAEVDWRRIEESLNLDLTYPGVSHDEESWMIKAAAYAKSECNADLCRAAGDKARAEIEEQP